MNVKQQALACSIASSSLLTLSSNAAAVDAYHTAVNRTPDKAPNKILGRAPIKRSPKTQNPKTQNLKTHRLDEADTLAIEPLLDKDLTAPVFLEKPLSVATLETDLPIGTSLEAISRQAADLATDTAVDSGTALESANAVLIDSAFKNDSSQSKTNQQIDTTIRFQLPSANSTPFIRTGIHTFQEDGIEDITNFPLQIGIEKQFKDISLSAGGGGNFFNRLPATPSLFASVNWQATPRILFSGDITYRSYKFSAASLENNIRAVRVTPAVYWQIDPATSFYSSFTWGNYSDGNQEQQIVVNLERTAGGFFIKTTAFFWAYDQDLDNGYFDPDSYSLYEGEIGWEGRIAEGLNCRIAASLGRQSFDQDNSTANGYKGNCTAQLSPSFEAGLGYYYSNTINTPSNENNQRSVVSSHVKFSF